MTPFQSAVQKNTIEQDRPSAQARLSPEEQELAAVLEQENLCLSRVVHLLKTENDAIAVRDTETMGTLLDKKIPLLSNLEQLEKQRQNYFEKKNHLAYSSRHFTQYIEQQSSELISTLWNQIKQQLSQCKKQNELNGRMITIRKDNTEQILQILLGRPMNNAQTYSHLGQTHLQKRSALYTAV